VPILFVVNLNRGSRGIESVALRKTTFLAFRSPNTSVFLFAVTPVFTSIHSTLPWLTGTANERLQVCGRSRC
jgi:hypothetical protein